MNEVNSKLIYRNDSKDWFYKVKIVEETNSNDILSTEDELEEKEKVMDINIKKFLDQQVYIYEVLLQDMKKDLVVTLKNSQKYVFIELPAFKIPACTFKLVYELQMMGFIPVIVNPELNQQIIHNPNLLYQLVRYGALTQVGGASISGKLGRKTQVLSLQFIKNHLAHFVADDDTEFSNHKAYLNKSYKKIRKKYGEQTGSNLLKNSHKLIEGGKVDSLEPTRFKKRTLWNKWVG
ncbi:CpsB/CapC family capsule biosynthesis tyrosine phosphatase [Chengkuizengella axinellae]|uniref:Tyrosine-protein phosphatase n=1 Tax=Chengkuizengella axinellae TaxID=3064388 RepID=A0ABT9J082_9BACL|nr:CpsB/CapC family capsule biosynthesis tyrosine phosphatase [Chengkuizengella sp. 2205SS18-9]MDP5275017.1 CpsB/CapC family capsule biosynthesis tyrosine phosphatase [Chengkuizengella sp. 2205SS18-9]